MVVDQDSGPRVRCVTDGYQPTTDNQQPTIKTLKKAEKQ